MSALMRSKKKVIFGAVGFPGRYELGWMVLVAAHGSARKDFIIERGVQRTSASIVRKFSETVGCISLGSALGRAEWPVVAGGHYYCSRIVNFLSVETLSGAFAGK